MKSIIKTDMDKILEQYYPLFVTSERLALLRKILAREVRYLKGTLDFAKEEHDKKYDAFLLASWILEDIVKLQQVADKDKDAEDMTLEYLQRFTPWIDPYFPGETED